MKIIAFIIFSAFSVILLSQTDNIPTLEQFETQEIGFVSEVPITIDSNYLYESGITYDEDGEILFIREAITYIEVMEGITYLTLFYQLQKPFRPKQIETYEISSPFFNSNNGMITAKGYRLIVDYRGEKAPLLRKEPTKFIFFLEENQLIFENLVNSKITFILTDQRIATTEEMQNWIRKKYSSKR